MKKLIVMTALALVTNPAVAINKNTTMTNSLALKKGQSWTWQQLAKTPKVKWEYKTPKQNPSASLYQISGRLNKYSVIEAYGTKSEPSMILINSSQSYEESEDGANTYGLYDLFNKAELSTVKSNCNKNEGQVNHGEYQHFYKWQKPGYQPLYVYEGKFVSGTFAGGVIKEYGIVKNFNDFNKLASGGANTILDRYVGHDSEITCSIS